MLKHLTIPANAWANYLEKHRNILYLFGFAFLFNVFFVTNRSFFPESSQYLISSFLIVVQTFLFIGAATLAWRKATRFKMLEWKLLALALLIWIPGQYLFAATVLFTKDPYVQPAFINLFGLSAQAIGLVGATMLGLHGLKGREKIQIIMNAMTFGSCIAFIGVVVLVGHIINDAQANLQGQWVNLAFFTFDVLFISLTLAIVIYRRFEPVFLPWGVGLLIIGAADIVFILGSIYETDILPLVRASQYLYGILWVLGGIYAQGKPTRGASHKSEVRLTAAAYVAVLISIAFTLFRIPTSENISNAILYSFVLMFLTILVSQYVSYRDNQKLVANQQESIKIISKSEEKYQKLAIHDTLTDLSNRTHFIEELKGVLSAKEQQDVAVFFIDLDRFKEINDTFGHAQGDEVIKTVAIRISKIVDRLGLVCRLGGDEFAVLVAGENSREALNEIAYSILNSVIDPIQISNQETYLTCSIGIAVNSDGAKDASELLRNADAAMYRAKEFGRNRIEFSDSFVKTVQVFDGWSISDLHRALAQKEFTVRYQPIIELATGTTVSYEALIRWEHPVKGFISPAEFIPVAEDNGLIIEIGDIVLKESIGQLGQWNKQRQSTDLLINVNLSPRQLDAENFVSNLQDLCSVNGVESNQVIFEVVESSLLGDIRSTMSTLKELDREGYSIHIDDFGTGYSSLSYLKKFPIAGFKIDQSFIKGYGRNDDDTAIVNALISLGKSLELVITAEGIQTIETRDAMQELGCNLAQGYLWSEALLPNKIDVSKSLPRNVTLKSVESA